MLARYLTCSKGADLVHELTKEVNDLRRGWGLQAPDPHRVGPRLRAICGIADHDSESDIRRRLSDRINSALATLPDEPRIALSVALCLHPGARLRGFEQRREWLARHLKVSSRTALRRVDEAVSMLVAAMWQEYQAGPPDPAPDDGYYVERLSTLLVLDGERPEALERRIIVAEQDGLEEITNRVSVPRHTTDTRPAHGLLVDLLYGGTIEAREQPYESVFRHTIRLPVALRKGERHEYLIRRTLPAGQSMAPYHAHVPLRRCDRFELRIRFDHRRPPSAVWRMEGVPTAVLRERDPAAERVRPDRSGEVLAEFRDLVRGLAYGFRWRETDGSAS
jgi:hypothetical protein